MTQKKTVAAKAPIPKAVQSKPAHRAAPLVAKATVKKDAKPTPVASKAAPKAVEKKPVVAAKKPAEAPKAAAKPVQKPAVAAKPVAAAPKRPDAKAEAPKMVAKKAEAAKPVAMQAAAHKAVAKPAAPVSAKPPMLAAAATKPAAPTKPAAAAPAAITAPPQPVTKAAPAAQAAAATAAKKPVSTRHGFKTNEWIVYPAHGVGRIVAIEEQEIANMSLELFVITFEKDKMTLRVPTGKAQTVGMRKLADEGIVKRAMETLKGKARIKRTMWSRRAQEFEAKINSGDLVAIAEVVRDLYRAENQPEQSYSERQLYEAALDRMAREIAAVDKLDERGAVQRITEVLSKSAKGRRAAAEESAQDASIEAA